MGCIVITMPVHADAVRLGNMIIRSGIWDDIRLCERGGETLEMIHNQDVSLVICSKRFSDMGFEELADLAPPTVTILLLTKDVGAGPFYGNVMRLCMPFKAEDLISSVRTLMPGTDYSYRRSKKPKKPARSDSEKKLVDDAKRLLMDRNDMTEPEAFRYIQKTSMDTGRSMTDTAEMILMMGK